MYHVYDGEPPSINNDGGKPDSDHQADKDDTDNVSCDVHVSMFNDTYVSIDLTTLMK